MINFSPIVSNYKISLDKNIKNRPSGTTNGQEKINYNKAFTEHFLQGNNLLSFGMARIAYTPKIIMERLATNGKHTVPYDILKKYFNEIRDCLDKSICKLDTPEIISYRIQRWMGKYERPAFLDAPERLQYKKASALQVYNSLYKMDKPVNNKKAFIVFGLPASGKTTTVVEPLAKKYKAMIFDGDRTRSILPEYKIHQVNPHFKEELKQIEEIAIDLTIKNGDNFIHNIVYRNKTSKALKSYIKKLKDAGFEVHLVLADISPQKAAIRAKKRFEETGRFVDPYEILSMGKKYRTLYTKLKTEGHCNCIRYSTDVPMGEFAKELENVPMKNNYFQSRKI